MKKVTATGILRKLAGKDATIFNDKLKNGTRSYKVEFFDINKYWTDTDYLKAADELQAAGFDAKVVTVQGSVQLRLHVFG